MFESLKNTKKLLDKLKKVCTRMSKLNINSPCLLQIIRQNGEYDFILTHNPINGDRYDFYKIFSSVTYDNFHITEDDENCFSTGDERVSIPIIVSSCELTERTDVSMNNPKRYWVDKKYDYSEDSYYIFPKFVLKAIKEEIIKDFEVQAINSVGPLYKFHFNIVYDKMNPRFTYTLFIHNTERLESLYNLSIFPLHKSSMLNDILNELYLIETQSSFIIMSKEVWTDYFEKNKYNNAMTVKGFNDHEFVIYHNDFLQKNLDNVYVNKVYDSRNGNIVSLYFNINDPHKIHSYFKYRYYEL